MSCYSTNLRMLNARWAEERSRSAPEGVGARTRTSSGLDLLPDAESMSGFEFPAAIRPISCASITFCPQPA